MACVGRVGLAVAKGNSWLAEFALERRVVPLVRLLMREITDDSQFAQLNNAVEFWRAYEPATGG